MLRVYQLESEMAQNPRILIDNLLQSEQGYEYLKVLGDLDTDGRMFLHPFKFDAYADGAEELVADDYDPRFCCFQAVYKRLREMLDRAEKAKYFQKYVWVAVYYNIAVLTFNKSSKYEKCELIEIDFEALKQKENNFFI